jgi:REP element-mobilizing transposase RayT
MKFNPDQHHRRSIRLRNYDYAQVGAYFVTLCTQGRVCLFGEVVNGQMKLNHAGNMVKEWWLELEVGIREQISIHDMDEYVVMPNHFHGIVVLVGAALCGRPRQPHCGASEDGAGHPHRGAPTLGNIMDWFKTMTTNEYIRGVKQSGWVPFPGRLWQRNYYEHVIRNEDDLAHIRQYILDNPLKWPEDAENPRNVHQPTP